MNLMVNALWLFQSYFIMTYRSHILGHTIYAWRINIKFYNIKDQALIITLVCSPATLYYCSNCLFLLTPMHCRCIPLPLTDWTDNQALVISRFLIICSQEKVN